METFKFKKNSKKITKSVGIIINIMLTFNLWYEYFRVVVLGINIYAELTPGLHLLSDF